MDPIKMSLDDNQIYNEGRSRVDHDLYNHDDWIAMLSNCDRSISDEQLVFQTKNIK